MQEQQFKAKFNCSKVPNAASESGSSIYFSLFSKTHTNCTNK